MSATVRDAVQRLLRELGMTTVFANPGSTELRFLRDFPADFRYVMALQEAAVVGMADAYAQITGNAAFVQLHSAGGVGNAMGALFTAYRNAAPLVIVAGQQTRAMLPSEPFLFAADATTLPRPYVKWALEPARAEDVPAAIARACAVAMERPYGPAFVSVPEDDWDRDAQPHSAHRVYGDVAPDPAAVAALASALDAARAPAIVAGAGVDRDGAADLLVRLAERLGAPVWASALASRCGFPEDHPQFAGALPRVRSGVVEKLRDADLVLVLGAPVFNYHVHAEGPFLPEGATLFHLTDDPSVASYAVAGTSIVAALRPALEQLLPRVKERPPFATPRARPRAEASEPMSIEFVLQTLAAVVPRDAIVVEEAPSSHTFLHDYLPLQPGGFFTSASGSLGFAMPAAVGAALAAPHRRVVGLIGDGSAQYTIQTLWSAARERLPIVYAILNNRGYGAMKSFVEMQGSQRSPSFAIEAIDLVAIAAGYGCRARRITRAGELRTALEEALRANEPVLLDIVVDTTARKLH